MKMLHEGRKILGIDDLRVTCTCVRVPVFRAHSISISAEFEKPVTVEAAREAVRNFEGSELVDNPENAKYPMPLNYSEVVPCGVGRIRKDAVFENGLALWVTGDQLWKGAALNAIQIAELLHKKAKL
jgi:aspartate-semialdehyde dehydrogenase